ncbi:hypothetical protein F4808DRAFT_467253 [Astrocystis sublimbata]|nr:hypothetical protein F4808DRAFT_467253 [Astrocystis sublimbata]
MERRSTIAISDYKPPHELSLPQLRAGLRELDIMDVVANHKIPVEEEAKSYYYATELVASAVTQTFHYMVKSGLAYGLLTTGEGIVLLKIDWDDPRTVYYHLAEPAEEVVAHANYRACSAVSQYLGFHLLALSDYSHRGQDVRDRAIKGLTTWTTDFRKAASTVPEPQRIPPRDSDALIPGRYLSIDRTVPRRSWRLQGDGEHGSDAAIWSIPQRDEPLNGARGLQHIIPTAGGDLAYCTQKCILGLVNRDLLDPDCPNLKLHRQRSNGSSLVNADSRHPISHCDFLQLLSHQLKCTLDYGITSLDITGARGALFKVTLLGYGYTFVSKGTVQAFVPDLEHKARVYKRLRDVQGVHVPVFLGAIDLPSLGRTYYYDFRIDIVHLCFMSWGGLDLRNGWGLDRNRRHTLRPLAVEAMRAIHRLGVVHKDARYENILFNPQTGRVTLIDFERSELFDTPRPTLAPLEPNKRRRVQDMKGRIRSVGCSDNFLANSLADLASVEAAFQAV